MKIQTQIRQNAEEISTFLTDLGKWEKSIKIRDKQLKRTDNNSKKIEIRSTGASGEPKLTEIESPQIPVSAATEAKGVENSAAKHTYDVGYAKWEKFDCDSEVIDTPNDRKPLNTRLNHNIDESIVNTSNSNLTPASLVKKYSPAMPTVSQPVPKARGVANTRDTEIVERERGNNEFKAGNFHAAVKAYTICLGLKVSFFQEEYVCSICMSHVNVCSQARNYIAFSNRAMTYLKLREFSRAEVFPCYIICYRHFHKHETMLCSIALGGL